jgi:hypothetical protein
MMAMGGSYLLNVGPDAKGVITEEYAERIKAVGDWYRRMEGALVCHEEDTFNYAPRGAKPIVTKKCGKSYFHFPDGIISSAISLQFFPSMPKSVRLLNTGKPLNYAIERMPEFFTGSGIASLVLHISGIPIDDLSNESVVIEVEW